MGELAETKRKKQQVLFIDPWGIKETGEYTKGLCAGISEHSSLTLITNAYFERGTSCTYKSLLWFFKLSEKMQAGKLRELVRGVEYVATYMRILMYIRANKFDAVHINWLLSYSLDYIFLRRIKKNCGRLVYTAHNVIPHINGEKQVDNLRRVYDAVDDVILHGNGVRNEFVKYFPEFDKKVYLQKHGCNMSKDRTFNLDTVKPEIIEHVKRYSRSYITFGRLDWSKGVDRVVEYWLDGKAPNDALLIVAGRVNSGYEKLKELVERINQSDNILFIDGYVEDDTLNYLISSSCLILMPYRHASMSGVVFTAADFSIPVFCTNVGSLSEYLKNEEDSFIVDNTDDDVTTQMDRITHDISLDRLELMGRNLKKNISTTCDWFTIANHLVSEVYCSDK